VQHVAALAGGEENSMEKGCSGQRCGIFLEASYGHEYFFIFKKLLIALSKIPCNKTTNNTFERLSNLSSRGVTCFESHKTFHQRGIL